MPKKTSGRTFVSAGISIDPETLAAAQERARKLRMGWSEYVRRCLEADIEADAEFVIKPRETEADPEGRPKKKW